MDTVKQIQDVFLQQGYVFQVDYDEHAEVVLVKVYWGGSNG